MKSDDAAARVIKQEWARVHGHDAEEDQYFGVVTIGDIEFKRFKITRENYASDECAPCKSTIKRLRDQIAKGIREEYGE